MTQRVNDHPYFPPSDAPCTSPFDRSCISVPDCSCIPQTECPGISLPEGLGDTQKTLEMDIPGGSHSARPLRCRAMTAADIPACASLAAGDPECWSAAALAEELNQPAARLFVAEHGGKVIAFTVFQLVLDEASLLAVHTAPACRRQGAAGALLRSALEALTDEGARTVFLEVRAGNTAALALYHRLGFVRAGLRRRFYRDPADDAVVMRKDLSLSSNEI